jgi:hypothetical protein
MAAKGRITATVGKIVVTLNGQTYEARGGTIEKVLRRGKWVDVKHSVKKSKL